MHRSGIALLSFALRNTAARFGRRLRFLRVSGSRDPESGRATNHPVSNSSPHKHELCFPLLENSCLAKYIPYAMERAPGAGRPLPPPSQPHLDAEFLSPPF